MGSGRQRKLERILVTGGCGFIGSAFIRLVLGLGEEAPQRLVNLDALTYAGRQSNLPAVESDARYRFVEGDILDLPLLQTLIAEESIDGIIHFAAESHVDRSIDGPAAFIQTNIVGTQTLLEVCRNAAEPIHFHHISTDEVYGSLGSEGMFYEHTAYAPRSPYSASKAAADHLVRAYANTYGLSFTLTNCSNNYGPYQYPEKLIPVMLRQALRGDKLSIYGDGSNVRDWLYVDDHCQAIWKVANDAPSGQTYNIGGDCELSNLSLVQRLLDELAALKGLDRGDLQSLISFVTDRAGHDFRYAVSFDKIRRDLGWKPETSIDVGISKTVAWFCEDESRLAL